MLMSFQTISSINYGETNRRMLPVSLLDITWYSRFLLLNTEANMEYGSYRIFRENSLELI
jgi:hypothetical protein